MPTWLQVLQDGMSSYVLRHLRYVVCPISNHVEVSHNFRLSYTDHLTTPRVYAVTGKNRWIAFCLCFMSFAQASFGIAVSIHITLHSGTISLPFLLRKTLRQTQILKAVVSPDPLFGVYRTCSPRLLKNGEVIYFVLSLVYGTFFLLSTAHLQTSNPFRVKDALALLIIVYSAKRHHGGFTGVGGMPSLLDKIRQDATMYFLVLSTGNLLFLFFQIFATVSDHRVDSRSAVYDTSHIGLD